MSVLEQRLTLTENKLKEAPDNSHYQSGQINGQTSRLESTQSNNTQNRYSIKALSNSK